MTIPDVQADGEDAVVPGTPTSSSAPHHPPTFRQVSVEAGSSSSTRGRGTGRPRGRPRKVAGAPAATVKTDQRYYLFHIQTCFYLLLFFVVGAFKIQSCFHLPWVSMIPYTARFLIIQACFCALVTWLEVIPFEGLSSSRCLFISRVLV